MTLARTFAGASALALLAGCSPHKQAAVERRHDSPPSAPVLASAAPAAAAAPTRLSRYTRLDACREIEFDADEGGSSVQACPGLAGYGLHILAGDLRETIDVELPGGGERSLDLTGATGKGGFSRLGDTVEWRGTGEGAAFRPDALIVRYFVVEDPDTPNKETSYLLAVSLRNRKPCVTATLAPGADQNERARAQADRAGRCLA